MTEGWMTRQEVAAYLKVSIRHLDSLRLPRVMLGRSPRYSRAVIDRHLEQNSETPGSRRRKGGLVGPPLDMRYPLPTDGEEIIRLQKLKLQRMQRRRSNPG